MQKMGDATLSATYEGKVGKVCRDPGGSLAL